MACKYVEEKPSQTHSPHLCGDTPGECYLVSTSFYSCWNAGIASISPHCFEIFSFLLWDNHVQSARAVKQCDMSRVYEGEITSKVGVRERHRSSLAA